VGTMVIAEELKVVEFKDGGVVFGKAEEIVSRDIGAVKAGLARITLFGPDILHAHNEMEETYVCESGRGKIFLNGQVSDFEPDDRVVIHPGDLHAVRPANSFPKVVFLCISGPAFDPGDVVHDPRGRNWK